MSKPISTLSSGQGDEISVIGDHIIWGYLVFWFLEFAIMEMAEEYFFGRATAEAKFMRVVKRTRRFRPNITKVSIRI
ncbi:hypothetical protein CL673_03525 [Candidatus Bathyarchaeota archaeon]|nr:hypothetical protein [Candidatus Bathyarchaeota archaeon]MDP6048046.1 hypothetical protein [Candidatus Bathyarchaeota archaeon]